MSAPMPSVPSATRAPSSRSGARPTPLFMFERGLWAIVARDVDDQLGLLLVEVDRVGEEGPVVERTDVRQAPDDPPAMGGHGFALVDGVLGGVDVDPGTEPAGGLRTADQRPVGQRERGMGTDHPTGEGMVAGLGAAEEPFVLGEPGQGGSGSVAVGYLVGQDRPEAEAGELRRR